jgi:hypothetical protein
MNPVRISCDGVIIASLSLPPFQLKLGEVLCLHLPSPALSKEETHLINALTGKRLVLGLHLFGRVCFAAPPTRRGIFGLFRSLHPIDWLRHSGGLLRAEAEAIIERLGLKPEWRLSQLPATPRTLLGLEAAWAQGAEVVVFSTTGLDPTGVLAVFEAVASRLDRCAAISLSYPSVQNGQMKRDCFRGALCLEVTRQAGIPVSLTRTSS